MKRLAIYAVGMLISLPSIAAEKSYQSYNCPSGLSIAAIYDGEPSEKKELLPDNMKDYPGKPMIWTLKGDKQQNYWIKCTGLANEDGAFIKMKTELHHCKIMDKAFTTLMCD